MSNLELLVTLWPSFKHFPRFALDTRIAGIRLNSAMIKLCELNGELEDAKKAEGKVPLYFDIKGRQLRVSEVLPNNDHLELILNHPISVKTPTVVLFKAAMDYAMLDQIVDGTRLIFKGGPEYMVYAGESLHIRHPSLKVTGETFTQAELEKIERVKKIGFERYFLSYVESQRDIDEFRELVGDSQIIAKIENKRGLEYVAREYRKQRNLSLMAARGDLYVELDKPHDMMDALKLIISKDRDSYVGSRILLSTIHDSVPSCADFLELAWLYDIGYRKMMLCDEICLKEHLLARAVNAFDSFRCAYDKPEIRPSSPIGWLRYGLGRLRGGN